MATGYVIAICFEGVGAAVFCLALQALRAEHRAKALDLKTFLYTGQSRVEVILRQVPATVRRWGDRAITLERQASEAALPPSEALEALRRATA